MHENYQALQGFVYNILTLLMSVCVIYSFCSRSCSLVEMCVGVSKFMQQHLMAVASAFSSWGTCLQSHKCNQCRISRLQEGNSSCGQPETNALTHSWMFYCAWWLKRWMLVSSYSDSGCYFLQFSRVVHAQHKAVMHAPECITFFWMGRSCSRILPPSVHVELGTVKQYASLWQNTTNDWNVFCLGNGENPQIGYRVLP